MNPKTVRSPKSLAKYNINRILKSHLTQFLQGEIEVPGVQKREVGFLKLKPGVRKGLEIESDMMDESEERRDLYNSATYEIGVHGEGIGYFVNALGGSLWRESRGDDLIRIYAHIYTHIQQRHFPISPQREPYSSEEEVVINEIARNLGLKHSHRDPSILSSSAGWSLPNDVKELQDDFRRLFIGVMSINDYLETNYARLKTVAQTVFEEGLSKYRDKS